MSEIKPPECWQCLICLRTFSVGDGMMAGALVCKTCVGQDIDQARERERARVEAELKFLETHEPTPLEEQVTNQTTKKENDHE